MSRPEYALTVGQGRSGTNWLPELLNRSAETFCWNKPGGLLNSRLFHLGGRSDDVAASQDGAFFGQ